MSPKIFFKKISMTNNLKIALSHAEISMNTHQPRL